MIRFTKWAIWLYLILLIFEGSLRKWVLPGFSDALLIIRDPVVVLIYVMALASGIVPRSAFLLFVGVMAATAVVFSFLAGQTNMLVTAYGIRTDFLHVPLIWIMAEVLDRDDVEKLGSFILILAIPMTGLMIRQFQSPQDAWINRGVGGDDVGQIYGALGRIRPPGFFSFITGPLVFYPLAMAAFLYEVSVKRRLWWPLLIASGLCIFIALPISISRGTMLSTAAVVAIFVLCLPLMSTGQSAAQMMLLKLALRVCIATVVLGGTLSFLPIFKEAREVFMDRWDTAAAESEGDAWGSLSTRVAASFTMPFEYAAMAPFFGEGIGVGSNVGARLLAGRVGFLLAEDEWGKTFLELGPLLGAMFIGFRIGLTIHLALIAWRSLRLYSDPLPALIFGAAAPPILLHQWAPPTLLGFAVFGGGLLMTAVHHPPIAEDEEDEGEGEEEFDAEEDPSSDPDEPDASPKPEVVTETAPLSEVEARRRRMRGFRD
jgi:hypothetical protein